MAKVTKLDKLKPVSFISSGVAEIDELCGGFPRARVSMVYGLASTGKTTLMLKMLSAISQDNKVLFCDVENALNVDRVKLLGGELSNIDYSRESVLESVCELVRANLNKYDVIILDSVAMLVPKAEHEGEIGDAFVGLKPRLLGQWLRMIEGDLGKTKCALILINQMRRTMEMYGDKFVLPGGLQLRFSSSLMLELKSNKADRIVKDSKPVGQMVTATVTKSKVSVPYLSTRFRLEY